jgi:hypothetical protein
MPRALISGIVEKREMVLSETNTFSWTWVPLLRVNTEKRLDFPYNYVRKKKLSIKYM